MDRPIKSVKDSWTTCTHIVQPPDTNIHGNAFGGTIMSWMDIAAATVATKHSGKPCVTASMGKIDFLKPIYLGDIVTIKACIEKVGSSSMTIYMAVMAENPLKNRDIRCCLAGLAVFVALGEDGKPTQVPDVEFVTNDESKTFQ